MKMDKATRKMLEDFADQLGGFVEKNQASAAEWGKIECGKQTASWYRGYAAAFQVAENGLRTRLAIIEAGGDDDDD